MLESRMRVAPDNVAYADSENRKLIVEFAIPGAPADTIDLKMLEDSVHLSALARDIEYVASLALGWAVKPESRPALNPAVRPRLTSGCSTVRILAAARTSIQPWPPSFTSAIWRR